MKKFTPVVRAFIFNPEGQILLVRHKSGLPWTLPGGHVEAGENIHEAILREIHEEFGIDARFFEIDDEEKLSHRSGKINNRPLPISIYELEYTDRSDKEQCRLEYIFLMETDETITQVQESEIAEFKWFDPDAILMMKPNVDTWDFYIEILEKIIGDDTFSE